MLIFFENLLKIPRHAETPKSLVKKFLKFRVMKIEKEINTNEKS